MGQTTNPGTEQKSLLNENVAVEVTREKWRNWRVRRIMIRSAGPLQPFDNRLYSTINTLPHYGPITRFMRGLSTVAYHGGGWAVIALVLALSDGKRGRKAALEMLPALVVTNAVVERIIKMFFRRRRPFITQIRALVVGHRPGSWSFPSGHSAISFACASSLGRNYKRERPALYALASLVGFSRVYLGHHYPTDVLTGAALGEFISRVVVLGVRLVRRT